jgi:hypothetical protein
MLLTPYSDRAGENVVATFGRLLGCIPDNFGFDFCVTTPLGPNAVVRVHSIGDSTFDLLGRGYPTGYVDRKQNYWKELTGAEN